MILSLALVPPTEVGDAVAEILARTPCAPEDFTMLHRSELIVRIVGLGNVTVPEVPAIADTIRTGMTRLPRPLRLHLDGAWALENAKDTSVGLRFQGDVDGLRDLARAIPEAVQARGFYVDRREFLPRLSVGRVTATTELAFLERLVENLSQYRSPTWEVHTVEVMKRSYHGDNTRGFEVVESVRVVEEHPPLPDHFT